MLRIIRHILLFSVLLPLAATAQITDCNYNNIDDAEDIASGYSIDADQNGIPDECDRAPRWTWMKGSSEPDSPGSYGELGVPADTNEPPAREGACAWTGPDGSLWLFGGSIATSPYTRNYYSDMWKYSINTNQWVWMAGSNHVNQPAIFGEETGNNPPSLIAAVAWTGKDGMLWLYGGFYEYGMENITPDALWRFDTATAQWTLVKGNPSSSYALRILGIKGVASDTNSPGHLRDAATWTDDQGNLWLFGGAHYGTNNDTWKYDPIENMWTWIDGNAFAFGAYYHGISPEPRESGMSWISPNGQFSLFGGEVNNSGQPGVLFRDIWQFSVTNNVWSLVQGDGSTNQWPNIGKMGIENPSNHPGAWSRGLAWVDRNEDIWFYSGAGSRAGDNLVRSALWKLNHANHNWTWVACKKDHFGHGLLPVYGEKGMPAYFNNPGGRTRSEGWTDQHGNAWLFGGFSIYGCRNDLWKLTIGEEPPAEQNWIVK